MLSNLAAIQPKLIQNKLNLECASTKCKAWIGLTDIPSKTTGANWVIRDSMKMMNLALPSTIKTTTISKVFSISTKGSKYQQGSQTGICWRRTNSSKEPELSQRMNSWWIKLTMISLREVRIFLSRGWCWIMGIRCLWTTRWTTMRCRISTE